MGRIIYLTFLDDSTSLANIYTTSADLDTKNKQKPSLVENTIWERIKWEQENHRETKMNSMAKTEAGRKGKKTE